MDKYVYILAPLIGFTGLSGGGFWGLGGGWFIVPAMMVIGVDIQIVVGASLLQMLPSTIPTVLRQVKKIGWAKRSWGMAIALPLAVACFIGGIFGRAGGELLNRISGDLDGRKILYLCLLIFIFFNTLKHAEHDDSTDNSGSAVSMLNTLVCVIGGFIMGMLSALLGVGGGMFTRPFLRKGLKVPELYTAMIARFLVPPIAIGGCVPYLLAQKGTFLNGGKGQEIVILAFLLACGGMVGFMFGARMHHKVMIKGLGAAAHRSFVLPILLIIIGISCQLLGYAELGRIMALCCGIATFFFIFYLAYFVPEKSSVQR